MVQLVLRKLHANLLAAAGYQSQKKRKKRRGNESAEMLEFKSGPNVPPYPAFFSDGNVETVHGNVELAEAQVQFVTLRQYVNPHLLVRN